MFVTIVKHNQQKSECPDPPGKRSLPGLKSAEKMLPACRKICVNMPFFTFLPGSPVLESPPASRRFPALPVTPVAAFFAKIQGAFPCFKGKNTGIHLSDPLKNPGGKYENTIKIQFESVKMTFPSVHSPESVSGSLTGAHAKISTRCTRVLILCCIFRKG